MDNKDLIKLALKARERAYAPYSNWLVGAALLTEEGKIYLGCNIENSSFTPTICAERTALFKAVSEGERSFKAIAIIGGDKKQGPNGYCSPCGVCRQAMSEFCDPDKFVVICAKSIDDYKKYKLGELLPECNYIISGGYGFKPKEN